MVEGVTFSSVGVGVSDPVSAGVCEIGLFLIGVTGFDPLHPHGQVEGVEGNEGDEGVVFCLTVTVAVAVVVFPSESVTV